MSVYISELSKSTLGTDHRCTTALAIPPSSNALDVGSDWSCRNGRNTSMSTGPGTCGNANLAATPLRRLFACAGVARTATHSKSRRCKISRRTVKRKTALQRSFRNPRSIKLRQSQNFPPPTPDHFLATRPALFTLGLAVASVIATDNKPRIG